MNFGNVRLGQAATVKIKCGIKLEYEQPSGQYQHFFNAHYVLLLAGQRNAQVKSVQQEARTGSSALFDACLQMSGCTE
jgi:hypothetical protein